VPLNHLEVENHTTLANTSPPFSVSVCCCFVVFAVSAAIVELSVTDQYNLFLVDVSMMNLVIILFLFDVALLDSPGLDKHLFPVLSATVTPFSPAAFFPSSSASPFPFSSALLFPFSSAAFFSFSSAALFASLSAALFTSFFASLFPFSY
jgi:hypothetical protein